MDNFYEQLITISKSFQYKAVEILTYIFGALGILIIGSGRITLSIFFIILAAAAFYFKRYLYIEYEYEFTNGDIDIDEIFAMSKRNTAISFNIREVEILAPENSEYLKEIANLPKQELNLYPKELKNKVYTAVIKQGAQRVKVNFIPDEEFVDLCYKYNPRSVKRS
ncbi:hypothetical protein [Clostridium sp. DJ247]|uniref:hypothetical protein n=1 Tax=Clostridium sp. DJ247 TaxID=2726188 RepID=UPI00162814D4|nr:hypothetical protein [Clostridium sp. DJ247]MBC2581539.1 hypothetical protein [Clostridium sp. DJ247]